jgi:hypothetical protein
MGKWKYFDGPGAFAPGPFLLLAEHVVFKGHALSIVFLEPGFGILKRLVQSWPRHVKP